MKHGIRPLWFLCTLIILIIDRSNALEGAPPREFFPRHVPNSKHHHHNNSKIVGGKPATKGQFPYQVSILLDSDGLFFCGGSIIDTWHILTAAHCTAYSADEPISVRVGSLFPDDGGEVIHVERVYQHQSYNANTTDYDISVLKLQNPITLRPWIGFVTLPNPNQDPEDGLMCTVSGFGTLSSGGDYPPSLRYVDVPILSREKCRATGNGNQITDTMICAAFAEGGKDSCQGDSGGALVLKNSLDIMPDIQVGIVSWGEGCADKDFPGVYTDVGEFVIWIRGVIMNGRSVGV